MNDSFYGELCIIGMRGCEAFTAEVDNYIKDWRRHVEDETYIAQVSYVSCAVSPHRRFELLPFSANFFFSRRRGDFSRRPHGAHSGRDVGVADGGAWGDGASCDVVTIRMSGVGRTFRHPGAGRRRCRRAIADAPHRVLRTGYLR